jgi:hypothetical protein
LPVKVEAKLAADPRRAVPTQDHVNAMRQQVAQKLMDKLK